MIKIIDNNKAKPLKIFKNYYNKALNSNQDNIEAIAISSFDTLKNEVESRFVNIKYINDDEWIFFSNYSSKKAKDFECHDQISGLFYWSSINVQIRIKAKISKTTPMFSDSHFAKRDKSKNILAIISDQSQEISSYDEIIDKFNSFNNEQSIKRPKYWGGYSFKPYYFEFWEGHKSRINKRKIFIHNSNGCWESKILQP